jgi:ribosomal protein bL25 (Ctc-form)
VNNKTNSLTIKCYLKSNRICRSTTKNFIPTVLYSKRTSPQHFFLKTEDLRKINLYVNQYLTLEYKSQTDNIVKFNVLIQEIQIDYLNKNIKHIDFLCVNTLQNVLSKVPVRLFNNDKPTSKNKFYLNTKYVIIKSLPQNVPENIMIDVEGFSDKKRVLLKDLNIQNSHMDSNLLICSTK